jgi:hypothetical protein
LATALATTPDRRATDAASSPDDSRAQPLARNGRGVDLIEAASGVHPTHRFCTQRTPTFSPDDR